MTLTCLPLVVWVTSGSTKAYSCAKPGNQPMTGRFIQLLMRGTSAEDILQVAEIAIRGYASCKRYIESRVAQGVGGSWISIHHSIKESLNQWKESHHGC